MGCLRLGGRTMDGTTTVVNILAETCQMLFRHENSPISRQSRCNSSLASDLKVVQTGNHGGCREVATLEHGVPLRDTSQIEVSVIRESDCGALLTRHHADGASVPMENGWAHHPCETCPSLTGEGPKSAALTRPSPTKVVSAHAK